MEPPHHPSTETEHASRSKQASLPHFDSGEASTREIPSVSSASGFSTAPPLLSLKLIVPTRVGRDDCGAPKSGPTGLPAGVAERTSTAWPSGPVTFVGTGSYRLFQRDVAATLMIALTVPTRVPVPTRRAWHTTAARQDRHLHVGTCHVSAFGVAGSAVPRASTARVSFY